MRHHQMAEDFPKLPEQLSPLPCSASDTHLLISFLYQPLSSFTDPRPVLFSRCQTILSCHVLCRFEFKPLEMSLSWQPNCSPSLGPVSAYLSVSLYTAADSKWTISLYLLCRLHLHLGSFPVSCIHHILTTLATLMSGSWDGFFLFFDLCWDNFL